jgi:4'-phosphopantetheinyl transferase
MTYFISGIKNMDDQNPILFPEPMSVKFIPELFPGEIHVWYSFYQDDACLIKRCREALTTAEFGHISYYKFLKDQNSFIVSRGLLRILLASYLQMNPDELNFLKHRKGKPYQVHDSDLFFNISNSGDCCIFAFSKNGEVGIDIEKIRPLKDLDELIVSNFTPQEQDYINRKSSERQSRFFKFWTLKEAFLKAIGEGMRLVPDKLEFFSDNGDYKLHSFAGVVESDDWIFSDLSHDKDYKGTLAHKNNSSIIKIFKFNS